MQGRAIEAFFGVYIASSKHEGELGEFGEFETGMQSRDAVQDLPILCLDEAENVLYFFYKIYFSKITRQLKGNSLFFYFLIKTDFLEHADISYQPIKKCV